MKTSILLALLVTACAPLVSTPAAGTSPDSAGVLGRTGVPSARLPLPSRRRSGLHPPGRLGWFGPGGVRYVLPTTAKNAAAPPGN